MPPAPKKPPVDPRLDPGEVALHARNVTFDWSRTPARWMGAEPVASHLLNALSLLLPEGERMFCATYAEALPLVADEKLREQMVGFIGQESMHAESHDKVLAQVLATHGIDPSPYLRHTEYLFRKSIGRRDDLSGVRAHAHLVERLAFIATLEHFFAFAGNWVLNADLERFDADPMMLDLFRWHGAEEVEHRFVAHDVAEYFGVNYRRRLGSMAVVAPAFVVLILRGAKFLIRSDASLPDYGYPRLLSRTLGAMWRGSFPGLWTLLARGMGSVLNPRYTPAGVGNTSQALAYLSASPAAKAAA